MGVEAECVFVLVAAEDLGGKVPHNQRKNSLQDMPGDALKRGAATKPGLRHNSLVKMSGDVLKGPAGLPPRPAVQRVTAAKSTANVPRNDEPAPGFPGNPSQPVTLIHGLSSSLES
jgi:hypothetical protein